MGNIDSVERKEAVIKSVVNTFLEKLNKLEDSGIDIEYFKGKHYILWIETNEESTKEVFNDLTKKKIKGVTLEQVIMDGLYQQGIMIDSIEIRHGTPEGNHERKEVADVVMFIEEKALVTAPTPTQDTVFKARITLAPGSPGGLVKPKGYRIDSKHVPYNIGRVIEPDDPINRVNDIEIVDDTYTVSRTQAHIGFSNESGFYIEREKGDNRTKVFSRDNLTLGHKLAIENIPFPLIGGEIIELNGYVRLLFQIID